MKSKAAVCSGLWAEMWTIGHLTWKNMLGKLAESATQSINRQISKRSKISVSEILREFLKVPL